MATTMKDLAALLGVEIGEEFNISGFDQPHRFTEMAFEFMSGYGWRVSHIPNLIPDLFSGKRKIIKKPWKPKVGEEFFVCVPGYYVRQERWNNCTSDLMTYAVGNCFRTHEEAEAHSKEVLASLEKIYDDGKPLLEW